ncbi:MAG: hypothetical protein IKH11_03630, partial [Bacteroidales bacterium]|nr:hypothetical protein [Bacteroidales bacterium]
MKKIILLGLSLFILCIPACIKPVPPEPEELPEFKTVTLTAEQIGTKSCLGAADGLEVPILWEASDVIWVRSASQPEASPGSDFTTDASSLENGGKIAKFTGELLNKGPYVAVYPYSAVAESSDNSKVTVRVPQTQRYHAGSFGSGANISAAVWKEGTNVRFSSIAGTVRLSLKGYVGVSRVVITDNDPGFALWGDCLITPGEDSITAVEWKNSAEERNQIILDCSEGIQLSLDSPVDFYAVVPAGAFAKGFTLTMYDASGSVVHSIVNNDPSTVSANQILPAGGEQKPFAKGSGTESDPYIVSTPGELAVLAFLTGGEYADKYIDKHYRQTADINMNEVALACIAANKDKPFKGSYDGGGFTISNLAPVPANGAAAALFAYTDGAVISNLKIDGYKNAGDNGEQGVIAGRAVNTTFSNIGVQAQVQFVKCACGGIVGYMDGGKIENCDVSGFVHDEKYADFKGVTVVSCVGGIVGYANNAEISGCIVKGDITAAGEQLGGIVGQAVNSKIDNCKVLAGSTVTGDNYYAGGIAGEA